MEEKLEDLKKEIRELIRLNFILPEDIPEIELYMDQVTRFMDTHLQKNSRSDSNEDKTLTKTMINNYIKNKLLPPPEKKKYTKEHIIMLISIYYLKNFISISDIQKMLSPLIDTYFDKTDEKGRGLPEIYEEIFELGRRQYFNIENSIIRAQEITDLKMADEDEYLNKLVFIYMLAYDIYGKKRLVEQLIDEIDEAEKLKAEMADKKNKKTAAKKIAAKKTTAKKAEAKKAEVKKAEVKKVPAKKAAADKSKTVSEKKAVKSKTVSEKRATQNKTASEKKATPNKTASESGAASKSITASKSTTASKGRAAAKKKVENTAVD